MYNKVRPKNKYTFSTMYPKLNVKKFSVPHFTIPCFQLLNLPFLSALFNKFLQLPRWSREKSDYNDFTTNPHLLDNSPVCWRWLNCFLIKLLRSRGWEKKLRKELHFAHGGAISCYCSFNYYIQFIILTAMYLHKERIFALIVINPDVKSGVIVL